MKQAHICLDETLGIRYAILPGDPARLDRIAKELEDVQELAYNREFRSLRGRYKGVDVLALSTGIGGSSAGIAVEELHNIGVQAAIRIGSCGALQKGIGLGELVLVSGAVRDDGASKAYVPAIYPAVADFTLYSCCVEAAKTLGAVTHEGICHSHESFYHEENEAESAYWSKKGVLGADMETAALFTIGRLRGMKTASILNNVVLYGEDTADAIGDYVGGESATAKGERLEILTALEAFYLLETGDFSHPRFRYAKQFANADLVVIAAPFWDLAFPALLKLYIEQVSLDGITFGANESGLVGLCRGTDLVFLTARGGFYTDDPMEMGSRYLDALHTFFGFDRYHCVAADGMDVAGFDGKASLEEACKKAETLAASL